MRDGASTNQRLRQAATNLLFQCGIEFVNVENPFYHERYGSANGKLFPNDFDT